MYIIQKCSQCGKKTVTLKTDVFICSDCGVITFGNFKWLILEKTANTALIISKNVLKQQPYHLLYEEVTWETCSLRKYLNNDFYNIFVPAGKQRIIKTHNKNSDNPQFATPGGNDTDDHIFLLSIDEAKKYFKDNKQRIAYDYDTNNDSYWWLRSPSITNRSAAGITTNGDVRVIGSIVYNNNGVRPALWLDLQS